MQGSFTESDTEDTGDLSGQQDANPAPTYAENLERPSFQFLDFGFENSFQKFAERLVKEGFTDKQIGSQLLAQIFRRVCNPRQYVLPRCSIVNSSNDFAMLLSKIPSEHYETIFNYLLAILSSAERVALFQCILQFEILNNPDTFARDETAGGILIKTISNKYGELLFQRVTRPMMVKLETFILAKKAAFQKYVDRKPSEEDFPEIAEGLLAIFNEFLVQLTDHPELNSQAMREISNIFQALRLRQPIVKLAFPQGDRRKTTYREGAKSVVEEQMKPIKIRVFYGIKLESLLLELKMKSYYVIKEDAQSPVAVYYFSDEKGKGELYEIDVAGTPGLAEALAEINFEAYYTMKGQISIYQPISPTVSPRAGNAEEIADKRSKLEMVFTEHHTEWKKLSLNAILIMRGICLPMVQELEAYDSTEGHTDLDKVLCKMSMNKILIETLLTLNKVWMGLIVRTNDPFITPFLTLENARRLNHFVNLSPDVLSAETVVKAQPELMSREQHVLYFTAFYGVLDRFLGFMRKKLQAKQGRQKEHSIKNLENSTEAKILAKLKKSKAPVDKSYIFLAAMHNMELYLSKMPKQKITTIQIIRSQFNELYELYMIYLLDSVLKSYLQQNQAYDLPFFKKLAACVQEIEKRGNFTTGISLLILAICDNPAKNGLVAELYQEFVAHFTWHTNSKKSYSVADLVARCHKHLRLYQNSCPNPRTKEIVEGSLKRFTMEFRNDQNSNFTPGLLARVFALDAKVDLVMEDSICKSVGYIQKLEAAGITIQQHRKYYDECMRYIFHSVLVPFTRVALAEDRPSRFQQKIADCVKQIEDKDNGDYVTGVTLIILALHKNKGSEKSDALALLYYRLKMQFTLTLGIHLYTLGKLITLCTDHLKSMVKALGDAGEWLIQKKETLFTMLRNDIIVGITDNFLPNLKYLQSNEIEEDHDSDDSAEHSR